ncbi:uncharacterized protein FYN12_014699 isoform 2-T2 [Phoenicopterus ruber ruber]
MKDGTSSKMHTPKLATSPEGRTPARKPSPGKGKTRCNRKNGDKRLFYWQKRQPPDFGVFILFSLRKGCQPEIAAVSTVRQINYRSNEAGVRLTAILNVLGHIQNHVKDFL